MPSPTSAVEPSGNAGVASLDADQIDVILLKGGAGLTRLSTASNLLTISLLVLAVASLVFGSSRYQHVLTEVTIPVCLLLMALSVRIETVREQVRNLIRGVTAALRESRRSAEGLRESQDLFRSLVQNVRDYAILTLDTGGYVTSWNVGAERIKGYQAAEIIGQHFSCFYTEEDVENGRPEMELRIAKDDGRFEDEGWLVRNDGTRFWANMIITALYRENGELRGFSKITRDMSERKRSEIEITRLNADLQVRNNELGRSNQELEAFTYSVAHDLRAPLRHIYGFSKILSEDYGTQMEAEAQGYLNDILTDTERMGHLIDDLLSLARLARQEVRIEVTGIRSVVDEVLRDVRLDAKNRDIEWRIGDLPFAACDRGLLKQVYANLLSNAVKYTRPRTLAVIEVGTLDMEGERVFFVRDNGVGFNMKYADKLFGVFQRLHRSEDFEGTGVGLATIQRIIHKHGGRVWADARLDAGATFYFTLGTTDCEAESIIDRRDLAVAKGA